MKDHRVTNRLGFVVSTSILRKFRDNLRGEVVHPGDSRYNAARMVWNGMIDKHPSLIVYCADEEDVIKAVCLSRVCHLKVAVRSGGHNVAGNSVCDGGIVIDLSSMKRIDVDSQSRVVNAGAGLTLGELDKATQAFGLAVPLGIVSKTGLAGLTIGGGIGWLMRKHGLTCDNLLSAEVVTAEGRLLTANAAENQDLFWGIRGGGGNFGIVVNFKFRLHPVRDVLGGILFYPGERAEDTFRFYRDYLSSIPDELTTMFAFLTGPPLFLHKNIRRGPVTAINVCYAGEEDGDELLKPLRSFCTPLLDTVGTVPFVKFQTMLDAGSPAGHLNYWKSSYLNSLGDDIIKKIIQHVLNIPSPLTQVHVQHMLGAVSRMSESDTAFSHREALCVVNMVSKWTDPAESEKNIQWTREIAAALEPFSMGSYVNFQGDEGDNGVRSAYSTDNYARLAALKNKYDPTNFFSLNQNIRPA